MKVFIILFVFLSATIIAFDNCRFRSRSQSIVSLESNEATIQEKPIDVSKDKWITVKKDFFSFSMPIIMKENRVKGIDSSIWSYSSEEISFYIESGDFTNNLEGLQKHPNYKEEWKIVDGQKAKFISFNYEETYTNLEEIDKKNVVAIHFSQTDKIGTNLTFWVSFRDINKRPIAIKIIESIKFTDRIRKIVNK